jgi:glyoxylase-like metal-dependent hydrolase (beta-lactamase superfamily II)
MRVTRHGRHLTQVTRLVTNCYLVEEDDGLTLVDCLWPGSARRILAVAAEAGAPIRRIALTHAHHDHTGSVERLRAALPDSELVIGARESRLLAGDLEPAPGEPAGPLPKAIYRRREVTPDRLLAPGDRVGSLEVIDAQGHTPGQVAFFDTRDGTLVCGDAYLTVGAPFVCTEPVLRFPVPALLGLWDGPAALASARALRALDPARLASGHGRVVADPQPAMDRALARAEARAP